MAAARRTWIAAVAVAAAEGIPVGGFADGMPTARAAAAGIWGPHWLLVCSPTPSPVVPAPWGDIGARVRPPPCTL